MDCSEADPACRMLQRRSQASTYIQIIEIEAPRNARVKISEPKH